MWYSNRTVTLNPFNNNNNNCMLATTKVYKIIILKIQANDGSWYCSIPRWENPYFDIEQSNCYNILSFMFHYFLMLESLRISFFKLMIFNILVYYKPMM